MSAIRNSALIPIGLLWRAAKLTWGELFVLGLAGYAWILLGLFVLPFAPMMIGLFYVANQVAHENAVGVKTVFQGARRFLGRSLIWGALNLLAGLAVWADLSYYQQMQGDLGVVLLTLAVLLALAWIVVQVLSLPFLIEAGPTHLKLAYRRAFLFVASQPGFVAGLLVVLALWALVCWYLPVLIGYGMCYIAVAANLAVATMLEDGSRSTQSPKNRTRAAQ